MIAALALAAALAAPAPRPAAPPDPRALALARRVQATYERTRDLEARFVQTYTYAAFGRRQVSSGRLQVKRPGKLRWDYEQPEPKVVLVSGRRLVQWEPRANQAYVDEAFDATAMSAAVTFLLGTGDLAREFELSVEPSGGLVLVPREEDPRVRRIVLTTDAEGAVTRTRVEDGAGNVNELRFEDVRRNTGLADAAFEVKLPRDVNRIAAPVR